MGLYDEGTNWRSVVKTAGLLALVLLDIYLLLPPPYSINIQTDREPVPPGNSAIVWVEVHNNRSAPLVGGYLRIESLSSSIRLDKSYFDVPSVPSHGKVTLKVVIWVDKNTVFGDHMLRIFFSHPGETEVLEHRVKVG